VIRIWGFTNFDGLVYISNIPSYNMNNSVKNGKIESSYNINRPLSWIKYMSISI